VRLLRTNETCHRLTVFTEAFCVTIINRRTKAFDIIIVITAIPQLNSAPH